MKIDRLIGILSILLQKDRVTESELAERFEVSRRTIVRDIEAINMAGIPITTSKGVGGGISIMDTYRQDRTLLTTKEMQGILAGLRSLDSISGTKYYSHLMDKLQIGSSEFTGGRDTMLIDLSSWYKDSLAPKIDMINNAIDEHRFIEFIYYSPKHESERRIEPYNLVFKWGSWYVYGYCCLRNDFRLFKLNRLEQLCLGDEIFQVRKVPMPDFAPESALKKLVDIKVIFDASVKWRVVEEYGIHSVTDLSDGRIMFQGRYAGDEGLISWILGFGSHAELLEPAEARDELRSRINLMKEIY